MLDPKWLEALKTPPWQAGAVAFGCFGFLVLPRLGLLPSIDSWAQQAAWLIGLIALALVFASIGSNVSSAFGKWRRKQRAYRNSLKRVVDYLPHLSKVDREILSYLLHHNTRVFTARADGELAAPLISIGFIVPAGRPGQIFNAMAMTFGVPDAVWAILELHRDQFIDDYTDDGSRKLPWRRAWQDRI